MLTLYALMSWAGKPLPFNPVMFCKWVKKSNRFFSGFSRTSLSAALSRPSKGNQIQIVGTAFQLTAR
jgi:hypothetical protein